MASARISDEEINAKFSDFLKDEDLQKQYAEERKRLIEAEEASSWDAKAKLEASEVEREAAAIVFRIRESERDDPKLFGNQASEAIPGTETRDMGGQFLTNLDRIEQSKLYRIAREMPKGCHLHIHLNSELHPDVLLQRAQELDTMFIRSTRPLLDKRDLDETEIVLNVLKAGTRCSDIFKPGYNPECKAADCNPWMKFKDFCEEFRQKFRPDLDPLSWITKKAALGEDDVYRDDQTLNG